MQRFIQYIFGKGLKATLERLTMAEAIVRFETRPFSVGDICSCMNEMGMPVSRSTVYRNLQHFLAAKMIRPANCEKNNDLMFKTIPRKTLTHNIECKQCGNCHTINDELLNEIRHNLQKNYKYKKVDGIAIVVEGLCKDCLDSKRE